MQQLMFEAAGEYAWRDAPEPEITAPGRPSSVGGRGGCDLDVAARRAVADAPGLRFGHEGIAEVVAVGDDVRELKVGDRVIVPFQISCGAARLSARVTGSCASLR